jgi:hypothetical protein
MTVVRTPGLEVGASFAIAAGSAGGAFSRCISATARSGPEAEGPLADDRGRVLRWISSR